MILVVAGTTLDLVLNKSKPEGNTNANNNTESHLKKPSEADVAVVESGQGKIKIGMEDLNESNLHSGVTVIPVNMVKESSGTSYNVTQADTEKKPGKLYSFMYV